MKIIRSYKEIHSKSFQNEEIFCEKSKTITYMQLQSREKFFLKVKKTFNRIIFFLKKNKIGGKAVYVSACHASRRPPCRCTSILNVSAILIDTIGRPPQKSNSTHTHTRWREMNKPHNLKVKLRMPFFFCW